MSRVPHATVVQIDVAKVRDYLLNPTNLQNRGKAALFNGFGFRRAEWHVLTNALREHPSRNEVVKVSASLYGVKYVVQCHLQTPDGRDPCLTSVWIIETGLVQPRFVTAY